MSKEQKQLIGKLNQAQHNFHQVFNLLAEVQEILEPDFEDLGDFASALATITTFGTMLVVNMRANVEDEKLDKGGK
jgi:hypothetical protein